MGKTKLRKRMVSKGRYFWMIGKKAGLYSFGGFVFLVGSIGYAFALSFIMWEFIGWVLHATAMDTDAHVAAFLTPVFLFIAFASQPLISRAKAIESVEPITIQNAHLLPLQSTLVRATGLPRVPPSELLRAIHARPKTPTEQLLRTTNRDE